MSESFVNPEEGRPREREIRTNGKAQTHEMVDIRSFDYCAAAVMIVQPNGTLVASNRAATDLLGLRDGLVETEGRLKTAHSDDQRQLNLLLLDTSTSQSTVISVSRRSGLPDYLVVRGPVLREAGAFVLLVADPSHDISPVLPIFSAAYRLSNAETRLLKAIVDHASLEDIAGALGVARNTVKSQVTSILRKTRMRSRSELLRSLLTTAAQLRVYPSGT